MLLGFILVSQTVEVKAECSVGSQQEAKQIYKKALNADTVSKQLDFLQKSLNSCYSPEIEVQIFLLKGDMAFDKKNYKNAKNYYNKMLILVDQIKDPKSRKRLHLLSYECLKDTYKAMGEDELASIMQQKYDMRKRQKESSVTSSIVSSGDIVKGLQLKSVGGFRGVSIKQSVSLHVNFEFDSVAFSDEGKKQAHELAIALKELQFDYPNAKVDIVGYTDTKGNAKYNLNLSSKRARALKKYLTTRFTFNKLHFTSTGKGESEPICSKGSVEKYDGEYGCTGSEDTIASRRVEIIFGY